MEKHLFTVLIVDDEDNIRSSLRRLLKLTYGDAIAMFFAPNGMQALEILAAEAVDLAIIDLMMPR